MTTDTSKKGLESLIVEAMTGVPGGVDSTQCGMGTDTSEKCLETQANPANNRGFGTGGS